MTKRGTPGRIALAMVLVRRAIGIRKTLMSPRPDISQSMMRWEYLRMRAFARHAVAMATPAATVDHKYAEEAANAAELIRHVLAGDAAEVEGQRFTPRMVLNDLLEQYSVRRIGPVVASILDLAAKKPLLEVFLSPDELNLLETAILGRITQRLVWIEAGELFGEAWPRRSARGAYMEAMDRNRSAQEAEERRVADDKLFADLQPDSLSGLRRIHRRLAARFFEKSADPVDGLGRLVMRSELPWSGPSATSPDFPF